MPAFKHRLIAGCDPVRAAPVRAYASSLHMRFRHGLPQMASPRWPLEVFGTWPRALAADGCRNLSGTDTGFRNASSSFYTTQMLTTLRSHGGLLS